MEDLLDRAVHPNRSLVDLSTSERYRLLVVERRRLVLEVLTGDPSPVGLEELAVEVAAREMEGLAVDEQTLNRVKITLHHEHLPALAEAGILEYDPESNWIDPGG